MIDPELVKEEINKATRTYPTSSSPIILEFRGPNL